MRSRGWWWGDDGSRGLNLRISAEGERTQSAEFLRRVGVASEMGGRHSSGGGRVRVTHSNCSG